MVYVVWTAVVSALVILTGVSLGGRWLTTCGVPIPFRMSASAVSKQSIDKRESAAVFGAALLFRVAVFLAASVLVCLVLAPGSGLTGALNAWKKWDAWHYVNLVELGYSGYVEDGQHLFLVFFPLYVWLVRLVRLIVGNTMAAGLLVSWLCFAGGCVFFYKLAAWEYGVAAARRAVVLLSLFPYAFFFGGMMTEGLFLLTTAAGLWYIRRHCWGMAGLWGILAALTRMHGLLLAGAALAELLAHREKGWYKRLPLIFLPLLGTLLYLGLNWGVTGDPFAFAEMQEHWSQGFCWISDTLWYVLHNAIAYGNETIRFQIWIPTLILFPIFFVLLLSARRQRSMLTLYAFAALVLDYSLSWLLSAGRYLSCAVPFFLFAAVLTEKCPRIFSVMAVGMAGLFTICLAVYLAGGQIM